VDVDSSHSDVTATSERECQRIDGGVRMLRRPPGGEYWSLRDRGNPA
jgi:hypothetical protein